MVVLQWLRDRLRRRRGELPGRRVDEMAAGYSKAHDIGGGGHATFPPGYFPKQDDGHRRH